MYPLASGLMSIKLPTNPLCKKTWLWFGCRQANTANDAGKSETTNVLKTKQKQAVLCCIALGEVRMNGARDKRQTNVTGHEPPLLSNEIKWQLLSEEGMLRERARERGVGGDFVRPGNWSHHKQIEFRSFWWARADQSIWPTTQCLSASQKDTLASNNRSTVNNWSLGSVSFS